MLRVHARYIALLVELRPVLDAIGRRNRGLHQQLLDALGSVSLNMAEASGNEGGTRRQRFLSSLGSLRESIAALQVAEAFGHVTTPPAIMAGLSGCVGTLVVLTRK